MQEEFLHYVWKYQKLVQNDLYLTSGQSVQVFDVGYHNQDSGPDFEEARIKIDQIEWAGNIEIHLKASDWTQHKHQYNEAYKNVILHVVWKADQEVLIDQEPIPTLELHPLVDPVEILKYQRHIASQEPIACGKHLQRPINMAYLSMLDRVLVERLERKANTVLQLLEHSKNDWEEVCYKTLATNFGFSTNKEPFGNLSEMLPYVVLKKNLNHPMKTEALLFGTAGFLDDPQEEYQHRLYNEYQYLASKFNLSSRMERHHWKSGKLRPANFPSVRIAQFAALLSAHPKLFSKLISIDDHQRIIQLIEFNVSDYWAHHYDFGKKKSKPQKSIGSSTTENILINTVVPLLAAYSKYADDQRFMDKAISLLENIKAESNRITKIWAHYDKKPRSAFESQGQIQLFNEYCKKRKCLNCNIGVSILSE